jgi:hypothetical protein
VTYEPGQQVLVRGMLEHRFADGLAYVRFSDSDDHMHVIEAADVAGPVEALARVTAERDALRRGRDQLLRRIDLLEDLVAEEDIP